MTTHVFTDSSSLEYAEYDDFEKILTVKFINGHQYSYGDVPKDEFDGLVDAKSAGRYFQQNILKAYKLV